MKPAWTTTAYLRAQVQRRWDKGDLLGARVAPPGELSRIAGAKLVRSMSRKGCSPDNAACEGFFGRLKTEMFFLRDWLFTTTEKFAAAMDAYIRWYSDARIKTSLGFRSPVEHRKSLGIAA